MSKVWIVYAEIKEKKKKDEYKWGVVAQFCPQQDFDGLNFFNILFFSYFERQEVHLLVVQF